MVIHNIGHQQVSPAIEDALCLTFLFT